MLNNLIAFTGGTKEICEQALRAANNNPDIAFEYVLSGNIPQPQPAGGMGGGSGNPLAALMMQP